MQKYLDGMIQVAKDLPDTKFLAYTKKNSLDFSMTLPKNLMIRFSLWEGFNNQTDVPFQAWIQGDSRIPKNSLLCKCTGHCHECGHCWNPRVKNITFIKH